MRVHFFSNSGSIFTEWKIRAPVSIWTFRQRSYLLRHWDLFSKWYVLWYYSPIKFPPKIFSLLPPLMMALSEIQYKQYWACQISCLCLSIFFVFSFVYIFYFIYFLREKAEWPLCNLVNSAWRPGNVKIWRLKNLLYTYLSGIHR